MLAIKSFKRTSYNYPFNIIEKSSKQEQKYLIPGRNQTINFDGQGAASTYPPSAWNVSVNVVWYPAARSRRSLASPYRPLFEVADNGSMIRSIQPLLP